MNSTNQTNIFEDYQIDLIYIYSIITIPFLNIGIGVILCCLFWFIYSIFKKINGFDRFIIIGVSVYVEIWLFSFYISIFDFGTYGNLEIFIVGIGLLLSGIGIFRIVFNDDLAKIGNIGVFETGDRVWFFNGLNIKVGLKGTVLHPQLTRRMSIKVEGYDTPIHIPWSQIANFSHINEGKRKEKKNIFP